MGRLIYDTFPKSGTVWLGQTLKMSFPEYEVIFGNHRIKTLENEENVITVIRNPLDSVASYSVFFNKTNINNIIEYYCRFMRGIIQAATRIYIAELEHISKFPNEVMQSYAKRFSLNTPSMVDVTQIKAEIVKHSPDNLPKAMTPEREKANKAVSTNTNLIHAVQLFEKCKKLMDSRYII